MRFYRFTPLATVLLGALLLGTLAGCSTPAVGDPCQPEQIPSTGFDDAETYIESSSVQCETRVCLVYKLAGDPREGCVPVVCIEGDKNCTPKKCPTTCETASRIYCSCRCDAGDTGFAECECPDGFKCEEVLNQGGPGVRGSYCVRRDPEKTEARCASGQTP